ncbi:hypothetical protein BKA93DRAFT_778739 [Sparassis latifolia]
MTLNKHYHGAYTTATLTNETKLCQKLPFHNRLTTLLRQTLVTHISFAGDQFALPAVFDRRCQIAILHVPVPAIMHGGLLAHSSPSQYGEGSGTASAARHHRCDRTVNLAEEAEVNRKPDFSISASQAWSVIKCNSPSGHPGCSHWHHARNNKGLSALR